MNSNQNPKYSKQPCGPGLIIHPTSIPKDPQPKKSKTLGSELRAPSVSHQASEISNISKQNPSAKKISIVSLPQETETDRSELKNYLQIRIQNSIEKIDETKDDYPLLEIRHSVLRIKHGISELFRLIAESLLFQVVVFLVIIANTIELGLEDPMWVVTPPPYDSILLFFACFYTAEFGVKVLAYGLFINSDSYFRSLWNLLDFTIIVTAWIDLYAGSGVRLSALRSLRILRPLRSINAIKGMKAIFLALVNALWPLLNSLFILFFFVLIFAIAALQLWMGELNKRCVSLETGQISNRNYVCGSSTCGIGENCVDTIDNPNSGVSHHDNILMSLITVFQIISLEGWTNNLVYTQTAFSYWSILYFMPLIFITAYLIQNFVQAVIAIIFLNVAEDIMKDTSNDSAEVINEEMFEEIYKNTIKIKHALAEKKIFPDIRPESKPNFTVNIIHFDKNSEGKNFTKFDTNKDEDLDKDFCEFRGNEINENFENILDEELFEPGLAIEKNSAFQRFESSKKGEFKKKSTGTGISKVIDKQISEFPSYNGRSNVATNQVLTREMPELEILNKKREDFNKLRSVVSVNNKTLNFLLKNRNLLKMSRVEIVNKFAQQSTSIKDVISSIKKPFPFHAFDLGYRQSDTEDPLILYYKKKSEKLLKKYCEFNQKIHVFKYLCLCMSKKKAFFSLNLNSKLFANEKKQIFINDPQDWSGLAINSSHTDIHLNFTKTLSSMVFSIWKKGVKGILQKAQHVLFIFITHRYTNQIMLISVVINTIVLSLERYNISQDDENTLQSINTFFTFFFTAELALKFIGLGPVRFIRDFMNLFDSVVVIISLVEVFVSTSGSRAFTAFRAIRTLRIFRVLRVVRIFRYLTSVSDIILAVSKSLSNVAYLFLLLGLFQIIFTLIGMQIYGGNFQFFGKVPRGNFDSFHWAFVTTYQVLSTENWNDILTSSLRSQAGPASCLFLVVWIVLGNFILLNLFLAILLDSFSRDEEEQVDPQKKYSSKMRQKLDDLEKYIEGDSEFLDLNHLQSRTSDISYLQCEASYYVFSKENPFRKFCFKIAINQHFDSFMLFLIILICVKLVLDTYKLDNSFWNTEGEISDWLDMSFTILFNIEFIIKSVAFGFAVSRDSYLRDNWNKLDFFIVVMGNLDLLLTNANLTVIKVFRLLRTLRPLKLIKHNISLKIIVNATLESIVAIINVWVLILLIFLIFAILGVSLMAGKNHSCSFPGILDEVNCVASGYEWVQGRFNFDNVLQAFIVLFIVMSQESWPNRMLEAVDSKDVGVAPQINSHPELCYFFIVFLFISNFFLLNLFTVIVFQKFNEAKKNESSLSNLLLSKEQVLWTEIQSFILKAKPWPVNLNNKPRYRKLFFTISKSKKFEIIMSVFIIVNLVSMAMPYAGASDSYLSTAELINSICTFVFITEAAVKLIGLGGTYFKSSWNRFDFVVVICSLTDVIITYSSSSSSRLIRQLPQMIRVIRVIRVLRLFRLVKSLQTLEKLLMIMAYSLPALLNVIGLLLLVFFIYAILGCYLYKDVAANIGITNFYNFSNFHNAMNILWRISTGEDYPSVMADTIIAQQNYANALYFISFVTLVDFVVIELFISIILQYFEEFYMNPYNSLSLFTQDLKIFKSFWVLETQEHNYKVDKEALIRLIGNLGLKFKFLKTVDKVSVIKLIAAMNIECDNNEKFYFNDILYALLRRKYEKKINKREFKIDFTIMRAEELKTRNALRKLRDSYLRKVNKIRNRTSKVRKSTRRVFGDETSAFFEVFFLRTVFNNWKRFRANARELNKNITPVSSEDEYPGENSVVDD